MRGTMTKQWLYGCVACICIIGQVYSQFIDEFSGNGFKDWRYFTGDGEAVIDFSQRDGYASIIVDATNDTYNIWWAVIQRTVSQDLDLHRLQHPQYELRIEARIRVSHAPRRVNLHLHTQKTTDFHTHLMEFDIPDTVTWHEISMTTKDFETEPGDIVNGQLALMDWGTERYTVDVDYFKVDVVDITHREPDKGEQVSYPPPALTTDMFVYEMSATQVGMIDVQYPDVILKDWYAIDTSEKIPVVTVGGTQWIILRWNLTEFAGMNVDGPALMEMTLYSLQRADTGIREFGRLRVVEILVGNPEWDGKTVTLTSLRMGEPLERIFNTQMVVDVDVSAVRGSSTRIVIPRPVMQRIVDGKILGLALRPLGPINAAFYSGECAETKSVGILYFNLLNGK
jgi:hypothetical protein